MEERISPHVVWWRPHRPHHCSVTLSRWVLLPPLGITRVGSGAVWRMVTRQYSQRDFMESWAARHNGVHQRGGVAHTLLCISAHSGDSTLTLPSQPSHTISVVHIAAHTLLMTLCPSQQSPSRHTFLPSSALRCFGRDHRALHAAVPTEGWALTTTTRLVSPRMGPEAHSQRPHHDHGRHVPHQYVGAAMALHEGHHCRALSTTLLTPSQHS